MNPTAIERNENRGRMDGYPLETIYHFLQHMYIYIYEYNYIPTMQPKKELREYLVYAGRQYIGHSDTRSGAMHIACKHNRERPSEWAKVVEVRK